MNATDLRADAIYLTPTGRRCRLVPKPCGKPGWGGLYTFRYLTAKTSDVIGNGDHFVLTAANVGILKREHLQ